MIINDPVHGFIDIPKGIITSLVKHPYFVRLNRIEQLGATSYVYPGGRHTRFSHSIGTLHLITIALETLRNKGCDISPHEAESVKIAMLLHDIGHGPMSHCLERHFVECMSHEELSLLLMKQLNNEFNGQLSTAIEIFTDRYPKHFLHELICSQLDMDRLDYLCRDSFFAGVREGNIGVERIIKMLNVRDDRLVVEAKGIYTIENYLMSRRLMYWQVYLHKTTLAASETLSTTILRAKELASAGLSLPSPHCLEYFLRNKVNKEFIDNNPQFLDQFIMLDDSDIISAIKEWTRHHDKTLSLLASNYTNRNLYKVKELATPIDTQTMIQLHHDVAAQLNIAPDCAHYFVRPREVSQMLYSTADDHINIVMKDNTVRDISNFSELLHSEMVDRRSRRHYLFIQRGMEINNKTYFTALQTNKPLE